MSDDTARQWWSLERDESYRPCVGLMLINSAGNIFTGQRFDIASREGGKPWQMPQGGIEDGESFEDAAFRELKEETGITNANIMEMASGWYHYTIPSHLQKKFWNGRWLGQAQVWILLRFNGLDSDIKIDADEHPEFCNWRWVSPQNLPTLAVDFKKGVYELVLDAFSSTLTQSKGKFSDQ